MTKIKTIIILILILTTTGCYNYRELNELAIISAGAIDKKDNEYLFTVQVINTQKQGSDTNAGGDTAKFTLYESSGKTLQEAKRKLAQKSPKQLYFNHMQLFIISEEVAKDGINNILGSLLRNPEIRDEFVVLISKESDAKKALEIVTPIQTLNSRNIVDTIKNGSNNYGSTIYLTLQQLFKDYLNDNIEPVIPSIEIIETQEGDTSDNLKESNPTSKIVVSDIAVLKKDKLVGYLSQDETIALNFIKNNIKKTTVTDKCDESNYFSLKIIDSKTNITPSINKNKIKIEIEAKGSLNEINCDIDLEKEKDIKKIQDIANKNIEKLINDTIDKAKKEYNSDIFGFSDIFYKSNPKKYKKIKDDWYSNGFKNIDIEVKSNITIMTKGNTLKVIKDE